MPKLGELRLHFVIDWQPGADNPRRPSVQMTVAGTAMLDEEEAEEMQQEVVRTVREALRLLRVPPDFFEQLA